MISSTKPIFTHTQEAMGKIILYKVLLITTGNFSIGNGNLVYTINGTTATSVVMCVNVSAGRKSCNGLTFIMNP